MTENVSQGVWGLRDVGEDPDAIITTPGKADPPKANEELAEKAKDHGENSLIRMSPEFSALQEEEKLDLEGGSPFRILRRQQHGGPHGGFYHDK